MRFPSHGLVRFLLFALACLVCVSLAITLPFRWLAPPTTAFMLQSEWAGDATHTTHYQWVPWEQISPYMALAVVAAEDQTFPTHLGFDFNSISQALLEQRERFRGASTISQQVAKNLYLWPGRNWLRKALEAYLTIFVEALWPKRRILEVYLNVAEFGAGVYGVNAASQVFFGKSSATLTLRESALMAAVLPNPRGLSVSNSSAYMRGRASWIEDQARQLGGLAYLDGI